MTSGIILLCGTAALIGLTHTLIGPDHYVPFIVMSRAGKWSLRKTALITFLCGVGHVLSSVVVGLTGIAVGIAVSRLELFEGTRGNLAAWLLIGFGFAYFVWGVRRAIKNRPHSHAHVHGEEGLHIHEHTHNGTHAHPHGAAKKSLTPWILFTIFVFGPCEPLIPLLMYPAAKESLFGVLVVAGVFSLTTIATMMSVVMLGAWGVSFAGGEKLERYAHAMAGATICLSGLAIQLLGL